MKQHETDEAVLDRIERQQMDEHDRQFGLEYFAELQREEAEREERMRLQGLGTTTELPDGGSRG
jgi:hypothetical protein